MSTPRFLADEDFNYSVVRGLRSQVPNFQIETVLERGWSGLADSKILRRAAGETLIVVSHDVSTMRAAAYDRVLHDIPMSGLLLVKQTVPIAVVIAELLLISTASSADEWKNTIEFLPL